MGIYAGIIQRYRSQIKLPAYSMQISLGEGHTPLIEVPSLANEIAPGSQIFVKYEGLNPTGSFKDRGMTTAISEAAGKGSRKAICASTGNTAASAAAYAARAGMQAIVIMPKGKVAKGKIAGAMAYGAKIIQIDGSFDQALDIVLKLTERHNSISLVNSLNPYRLEGQKTGAFEIIDELGNSPDYLCLPVGNAGNISAYWMGFKQYHVEKQSSLPKLLGVQAAGSAPLVEGKTIEHPETVATAIRIGKPARGEQALLAAQESGGEIIAATDEEILVMQKNLGQEGIWVEPASAAGLAGLKIQVQAGKIDAKGKTFVVVCTGHGLKDPDIIAESESAKIRQFLLNYDEIEEEIIG
jgi:threonine synthase